MSFKSKPIILIVCDYYLPGQKSGGGLRTLLNIVDSFHDKFDFRVITRDHDVAGEKEPYRNVQVNKWNRVGNAVTFYLSKEKITLKNLRRLISETEPRIIFFNSFFSPLTVYVLLLKRLRLISAVNIVLAPTGELTKNALNIKSAKKRIFLQIAQIIGLYRKIIWKASTESEKREIEDIETSGKIYVVPDLSLCSFAERLDLQLKPVKNIGAAKMVFLSRFVRKKNFKWLLENLHAIVGKLEIDVYGPIEDDAYWQECQKIIETLPENIVINQKGWIPFEKVEETLVKYHFFILPTLTENFGYVFLEASFCGCPLIISDQTPWLDLEKKGLGWDISLNEPEKWVSVINYCIGMDHALYTGISGKAVQYARNWLSDPKIQEQTIQIFEENISTH